MFIELLVITCGLLFLFFWKNRRPSRSPPGPPCFPFVGSVPLFGLEIDKTMTRWQKEYGDTYTFRIGKRKVIMLNNFETIRKVLADENTTGRDNKGLFTEHLLRDDVVHGLIFSQGQLWKNHRRFAISTLRDLGMGQSWLEEAIIAEVDDLCQELKSTNSQPVDPRYILSHSVSNIICAMVFGKRFSHSDKRFTNLVSLIDAFMKDMASAVLLDAAPFLKYIPTPLRGHWKNFQLKQLQVVEFLRELIKEHKTGMESGRANDFIDAFKGEADARTKRDGIENSFDEFQLVASVFDLFAAGSETTSTTLAWGLVYLLENPAVVAKIHEEMDQVIAPDQLITVPDRVNLPYTEAALLEIQRLCCIIPFNATHKIMADMSIDGFDAPKDTLIMTNIYFVHRDPRHWQNPYQFDPTRFLDQNGKVMRREMLIPFSLGKRACLGESLARMELWLFFTNIVHRFDLEQVPGKPVSSADYTLYMTRAPKPFQLTLTPRTNSDRSKHVQFRTSVSVD